MGPDLLRVPYKEVAHAVDDFPLSPHLRVAKGPEGTVRLIDHLEMSFMARLVLRSLVLDPLLGAPDLHTADGPRRDSAHRSGAASNDENDRNGATRHAPPALASDPLLPRPPVPSLF